MIKKYIKKAVNRLLQPLGFCIVRHSSAHTSYDPNDFKFLHGILTALLIKKVANGRKFNIVQVGANDGVTVDPVYPFASQWKSQTSLLLIEPQDNAFELLKDNYKDNSNAQLVNAAIGDRREITIYRIRTELQQYYEGVIGSGVTSESRSFVEKKAKAMLPAKIIKREAASGNPLVESLIVKSEKLLSIIKDNDFPLDVDWLQIDAEGYDDAVIRNSDIETIDPQIISYEKCHLSDSRQKSIQTYLEGLGYKMIAMSRDDVCAIKQHV